MILHMKLCFRSMVQIKSKVHHIHVLLNYSLRRKCSEPWWREMQKQYKHKKHNTLSQMVNGLTISVTIIELKPVETNMTGTTAPFSPLTSSTSSPVNLKENKNQLAFDFKHGLFWLFGVILKIQMPTPKWKKITHRPKEVSHSSRFRHIFWLKL